MYICLNFFKRDVRSCNEIKMGIRYKCLHNHKNVRKLSARDTSAGNGSFAFNGPKISECWHDAGQPFSKTLAKIFQNSHVIKSPFNHTMERCLIYCMFDSSDSYIDIGWQIESCRVCRTTFKPNFEIIPLFHFGWLKRYCLTWMCYIFCAFWCLTLHPVAIRISQFRSVCHSVSVRIRVTEHSAPHLSIKKKTWSKHWEYCQLGFLLKLYVNTEIHVITTCIIHDLDPFLARERN